MRSMKLSIPIMLILSPVLLLGQEYTETRILASDFSYDAEYGFAVDIDGDYAVVGSLRDDEGAPDAGAVYVYHRGANGWVEQAKLLSPNPEHGDYYALDVAIQGDWVAVAAYWDDAIIPGPDLTRAGSVSMFHREDSTWTFSALLQASDMQSDGLFGFRLDMEGDQLIVGSSGTAYIFKRYDQTWLEEAILTGTNLPETHFFGYNVSISGDYALVSDIMDNDYTGAAYVFHWDGSNWVQQQKLTASNGLADDYFGRAVSIHGDVAVVGAPNVDIQGEAGKAFVFERSGSVWTEMAILPSSGGVWGDNYGCSVHQSDGKILVGAYDSPRADNNWSIGRAFLYEGSGSTWEQTIFEASDIPTNARFGFSVAMSGDYLMMGSPWYTEGLFHRGAAYIYENMGHRSLIEVPGDVANIQEGIDLAIDGDTVLVHPGLYVENLDFGGKVITVMSLDGPLSTIIDGSSGGSVVTFNSGETGDSKLNGFTITNGTGTFNDPNTQGGGIYCYGSSPLISDCRIVNNAADTHGGGLYLENSQARIEGCYVSGNTSFVAGGIHVTGGSPTISRTFVTGNSAEYGGGLSSYNSSTTRILHSTIAGNWANNQGGGYYCHDSAPVMVNSIMDGNSAGSLGPAMYICCGANFSFNYSIVYPSHIAGSSTSYTGSLAANPLFVAPLPAGDAPNTGGNYEIQSGSPAIDAGTDLFVHGNDTLVNLDSGDYVGAAPDMGAFEYFATAPQLLVSPVSIDFGELPVDSFDVAAIELANTGSANLEISSITIYEDTAGVFTLSQLSLPMQIQPGSNRMVTVQFLPREDGDFAASVMIESSAGDDSVALAGAGLRPIVQFEPAILDLGVVASGESNNGSIVLRNIGEVDLHLQSLSITGANSGAFALESVSENLPAIIPPWDTVIVDIGFSPPSLGQFDASLELGSNAVAASAQLMGTGVDAAPLIISIMDVPADQGGWVLVNWIASTLDNGNIGGYGVWQLGPENDWVSLGTVPAIQESDYSFLAHTFGDSSAHGQFWSRFYVSAHSFDPDLFYDSPIDSGYSVDNLHPGIPQGLMASLDENWQVDLQWDAAVDEDFAYYKIYRGPASDFPISEQLLVAESSTSSFSESLGQAGDYHYRVVAVDANGNASEPSNSIAVMVVSVAGQVLPESYTLNQNYPNPFNPSTTIRFGIPEASDFSLIIYDLHGHILRSWVESSKSAGWYTYTWSGQDQSGKNLSTGVYFARLEAGTYSQTIKMLYMR